MFCCQDTNNHGPVFSNVTYSADIPETTPPGSFACLSAVPGGPKRRYPNFIFVITSVNVH